MLGGDDGFGVCLFRPSDDCWDTPNPSGYVNNDCITKVDCDGKCIINTKKCPDAYCDENNIVHATKTHMKKLKKLVGRYVDDPKSAAARHVCGWSNEFAFPFELGMYWNFTMGPPGKIFQRAMGCPGLDEPFGTYENPNWPYKNSNSERYGSPAMQCGVNEYTPTGSSQALYEMVDDLALDNEVFAENFMEGWQVMTTNGYS